MPNKQAFLFRLVDIANELFAMAASVSRAESMRRAGGPAGAAAVDLADQFCRSSRRRVDRLFHELWHNDDAQKYRTGIQVLTGHHQWLEEGSLGLEAAIASLEITSAPETADSRPSRPVAASKL